MLNLSLYGFECQSIVAQKALVNKNTILTVYQTVKIFTDFTKPGLDSGLIFADMKHDYTLTPHLFANSEHQ